MMKALSLTQPWATLVAIGAKRIETRKWCIAHRGPIAIHATKSFPDDCRALCWQEPFHDALVAGGFARPSDLPLGAILAVCNLYDCLKTEEMLKRGVGFPERLFGDYGPKRYAFLLKDIVRLPVPIAVRGGLGPWDVPDEVAAMLNAEGP